MREILFRGKGINSGKWIERFLFPQNIDSGYCPLCICSSPISANDYSEILGDWTIVSEDTVGQYTGLTDKNGKKIFEGDIVKVSSPAGSSYYAKIEYDCGCYWISNPDIQIPDTINNFNMEFVEVIGNIHDNFELFNNSELLEDKL